MSDTPYKQTERLKDALEPMVDPLHIGRQSHFVEDLADKMVEYLGEIEHDPSLSPLWESLGGPEAIPSERPQIADMSVGLTREVLADFMAALIHGL